MISVDAAHNGKVVDYGNGERTVYVPSIAGVQVGTTGHAEAMTSIQEEIINVLAHAGITPRASYTDDLFYKFDQLTKAIFSSAKIGTAALELEAVTNAKLASDSVNTAELVNGAVTNDKVATGTLSVSKIDQSTASVNTQTLVSYTNSSAVLVGVVNPSPSETKTISGLSTAKWYELHVTARSTSDGSAIGIAQVTDQSDVPITTDISSFTEGVVSGSAYFNFRVRVYTGANTSVNVNFINGGCSEFRAIVTELPMHRQVLTGITVN